VEGSAEGGWDAIPIIPAKSDRFSLSHLSSLLVSLEMSGLIYLSERRALSWFKIQSGLSDQEIRPIHKIETILRRRVGLLH
jgi:hypothetical protein